MTSRILRSCLAGALLVGVLWTSLSWSQEDWSKGMNERDRFRVYPHVDAGLRALDQQHYDKARNEFSRALELAPGNAVIAGYLAQALADAGKLREAVASLEEQLKRTPGIESLVTARDLYAQKITEGLLNEAQALKDNPAQLRAFMEITKPELANAYTESLWLSLLAAASTPSDDILASYNPIYPQNDPLKRKLELFMLLRAGANDRANQAIAQWPVTQLKDFSFVDELSFQLLEQNHPDQAIELLTKALPLMNATNTERLELVGRLVLAQKNTSNPALLRDFLQTHLPVPSHEDTKQLDWAEREREWLELASVAYADSLVPFADYELRYPENRARLQSLIDERLEAGAPLPTNMSWPSLIARLDLDSGPLLDSLTFRLVEANEDKLAWQLLMDRYPFHGLQPPLQIELLARLAFIAQRSPALVSVADRRKLSAPLDQVIERDLQAQILVTVSDCAGVEKVLADWSNQYGPSQWLALANCYDKQQQTGLAQYALEKVVQKQPTAANKRALAFVAYENKDNQLALSMWQEIAAAHQMTTKDWLPAVTTAMAAGNMTLASQWLKQYQQTDAPKTAQYWTLMARWLSLTDLPAAIDAMQASVALEPIADNYLQLAQWQRETGNQAAAIASTQAAIAIEPNNGEAQADLGFLQYSAGDLPAAQTHLVAALKFRPDDLQVTEQLAYIDQQLGQNAAASQYVEQAVDHLRRYPSDELSDEQRETLFALRRMNEDMSRRWTLSLDAQTGTGPSASTQSPIPGQNFKSYSQLELDYRLGNPPINNGKTISAYARVFGGSGTDNSALPIYAPTLGVGLRVKPFSEQVIYFAIEKQIPLDHGSSPPANTMLRASGSFFNAGQYSDDWHPVGPGWVTQNLYLDSAYYLSNQAWSLTADYRVGYHHKLQTGQTVEPYARLLANRISSESTSDIRVGAGIRWNLWANQSRYKAYASRYYLGLEIQGALQTYQSDRVTGLVTLGARW